ncbi:MAG: DEAD/DEAH box helicase, partial [Methanomicrobiales archaeon]|nr:DEAD/DEAH box helicase [Methanomicrobiales archaeon]
VFPDVSLLLDRVCTQLERHRLIWYESGTIRRKARATKYLAATLSMIHDEKKMVVFDIASRRAVGTLDESFVVGGIEVGAVFITKGQLWRVLEFSGDRVMVEPARHAKGELPSWEGEQIPVPFQVADEVGRLRRVRDFDSYTDDPSSLGFLQGFLTGADSSRGAIPTDACITLENAQDGVVCNVCAGTKVNEALARVLSVLISARFGTTVGIEVGAYRFLLRLPRKVNALDVREILENLDPGHVDGILRLALKRTALFRWKLLQVAKKFGAIDPDADYERISMPRLLETFEGTVVQDEAYRELLMDYMDAAGAAAVAGRVRGGLVRVATGPLSRLGSIGLFSSRDMIPPSGSDAAILGALKRRLLQDHVLLFCMHCRKWKSRTVVEHVANHPHCPRCGAGLIAALKPWEEDAVAVASRKKVGAEERALEQRLLRNANIVLSSGKKAVIALAARGVGPDTVSRILATQAEGDAFYREILKAESQYVRTHRFWQGTVPPP